MKTNIQTKLGLLGLLGALGLNSSLWWGQQILESGDFASRSRSRGGNSLERCIRDATNKPSYSEELLKCEDRDKGLTVTVSLRDTTRTKDSRHTTPGTNGRSVLDRLGHEKVETPVQPTASQEQVRSAVAKITVAKTTVRGCNNCEKKIRTEELFRDIEGGNREDFSDDPEVFAGQLIEQMKDLAAVLDDDIKEFNKEKRRQEKMEKEWKLCKKDEDGYEFEDESDLNSCFSEQLANLTGRELQNFMNTRFFPHLMNMALTNPEAAFELRSLLDDNTDRGGTNGALLKFSLVNFDSFGKDFSQRQKAIRNTYQIARTLPSQELRESFINKELAQIDRIFSNYANQRMGHEASVNPALAPQFELINNAISTGLAPRSPLVDFGTVGSTPYSGFSLDIANRALDLDLSNRILDVYPDYSRTAQVSSRAGSIDRTAARIDSRLRGLRR